MIVKIKNITFENLSNYEKILGSFDPEASDILNLSLWVRSSDKITLALRDPTAYVELDLNATVEPFSAPFGVRLEYQRFFYILNSYTPADLSGLELIVTQDGDNSTFDIEVGKDKLSLPHIVMGESLLEGFNELHQQLVDSAAVEDYNLSLGDDIESIPDFIEGVSLCLSFVSPDEKKNNAISIYKDRLVVNDRRHIYTYYGSKANFQSDEYIPLHKKIAKILLQTYFSCPITSFKVFDSSDKVFLQTSQLMCLLNNAMANVVPPSQDDLNEARPSKKICDIDVAQLRDTSNFFSGFYSSSLDLNPIILEYNSKQKDTLTIKLRDSGLRGGSCSITRELTDLNIDSEDFEAIIINDSLRLYLSKVKKETTAELWVQNDKPAVYIKTGASDIYLAKFI